MINTAHPSHTKIYIWLTFYKVSLTFKTYFNIINIIKIKICLEKLNQSSNKMKIILTGQAGLTGLGWETHWKMLTFDTEMFNFCLRHFNYVKYQFNDELQEIDDASEIVIWKCVSDFWCKQKFIYSILIDVKVFNV